MDLLEEPISKIMSRDLITVRPNSLLSDVVDVFNNKDVHHIPVVNEEGSCVGIISTSDYQQLQSSFTKLRMHDYQLRNRQFFASLLAKDAMTHPIVELQSTDGIEKAVSIFLENKIRAIVIQDEMMCVGIVTAIDVLQFIYEEHWSKQRY